VFNLNFFSLDQSYHLAPLYSIKCMHNVAPIEHGKQTFHRSLRVPAVFSQDAPSVLNGADDGILVGIVHDGTQLHESGNQDWRQIFVPFGAAVLCLGDYRGPSRVLSIAVSDSLSPRG
jgi:hypothetical protein